MEQRRRDSTTILITGGAGFVGSNLSRTLLSQGSSVVLVDNFITGQRSHAEELTRNPRCTFIEEDVSTDAFLHAVSGMMFESVYHLACPTGVPNIERLGEEMLVSCSLGTRNVLEVARRSRAPFVLTSSCEVYGEPNVFPQKEHYTGNVSTTGPRSAYEEGKRFAEALVACYARKYNLTTKIVRIFNAYGPGMSLADKRVIPQFLKSFTEGSDLTIYGDGSQTRTFIYVDDLIIGLKLVMERGGSGEVYNIGGEDEVTMLELAQLFFRIVGRKLSIVFREHFIEDHRGRRPSVDKIKLLGWHPSKNLREGLEVMLSSYGVISHSLTTERTAFRSTIVSAETV